MASAAFWLLASRYPPIPVPGAAIVAVANDDGGDDDDVVNPPAEDVNAAIEDGGAGVVLGP
jgi:hypothetical protein